MLIFNGLEKKSIISVLDNDPKKQGEFLYGTNYKVFSPKILKRYKNPTVILRAGEYNGEIKKNILSKINATTKFIWKFIPTHKTKHRFVTLKDVILTELSKQV